MTSSMVSVGPAEDIYFNWISADEGQPGAQEVRNDRALAVYNRVQNKITGVSF